MFLKHQTIADKATPGRTERRTQEEPTEETEREGPHEEQSADPAAQQGLSEDPTP